MSIAKTLSRYEKDYIVLGIYDKAGVLLNNAYLNDALAGNEACRMRFSMGIQNRERGSIRIFILDSFDTMTALSERGALN